MPAKNPFDFSDLFNQADSANMIKQFQEMFTNSSSALFDSTAIADSQRKNFQAMVEVSQAAISGSQALLQKQTEMMQKAVSEATDAMKATAASNPDEVAVNSAEAV